MTSTKGKIPPLVQFYEKVHDKVYTILRQGLIFSYTDVVRTDRISTELTLEIITPEPPHTIILNGKELLTNNNG